MKHQFEQRNKQGMEAEAPRAVVLDKATLKELELSCWRSGKWTRAR